MAEEEKQEDRIVQGIFHLPEDRRISYANITRFNHVGGEVILDIGVVDEQKIIAEAGKPTTEPLLVDVYVQHRIAMGLPAFLKLKSNIDEIIQKMVKSGFLAPTAAQDQETDKK